MANPQQVAGHSARKPSGSSSHSRGHSPSASATAAAPTPPPGATQQPGQHTNKLTAPYDGLGTDVRLSGAINGSWEVWGNGSRRTASIGSVASVQHPITGSSWGPHRSAWTAESSSGPEWPVDVGAGQAKKEASSHSPTNSFSLRHRSAHSAHAATLNGARLAGLGEDDSSRSNARFDKERFSAGSSPSVAAGSFATSYATPSPANSAATPVAVSSPADDLTVGLRNLALKDDYASSTGATPSGVPTVPVSAVPPTRGPAPLVPGGGRPNYGGFIPQAEYYYNGQPGQDYSSFGTYDSYRSTPDTSLYGSPALHSPPPTSLYPTPQPMVPHDLQRSPSAMYFDFSAQGRPPPSPFYYPSPQPMVYHRGPHSPMPAPITLAPPPAVADKTGGSQFQHAQRLPPHQQGLIMQPPASPLPHMFPGAMDYSQQMQMVMQPAPYQAQPPHGVHPQHAHGPNPQAYPQHRGPRRDEGPPAMRSQLLDEFRTNKTRKWELRDIFGYVVEFSGDQHGSRFIQQKLEAATTEEKQIVFDEIVPSSALQLIQDVFGNYVIQKLFEHGSPVQKTALAKTMEGHILQLSLQMYGCRVVQKAIEHITAEQQALIVKELESHVLKCVLDANGNHVIQKLIECVSPDRLGFVNAFRGSVYDLSTHPFGCRVLQRCFEHMTEEQTRPLLDELHKYTTNLMQDQFGNYVVQFVLEKGKPEDRMLIVSKLRGQMLHMAKHKFASNVCEKALLTADEENQRLLIDEIMTPRADGLTPLVTMMKDQFANYVLQRALQVAQGEQRKALFTQVRSHLTNMKRYSSNYTKHLVAIERIVNAA